MKVLSVVFAVLIMATNSFAGLYSTRYDRQASSVITAVQIKDRGIYNLVISADFLRRPQDKKVYASDEYEELINRLSVEWRGIATRKVLEAKELSVSDLIHIRQAIESEVRSLAEKLKAEYLAGKAKADVVFSISDFFLLDPKE